MTERSDILEVSGVQFAYRAGSPVLEGVSVAVSRGSLLCLLGPNGSGKTTLLRCMLGQLKPAAGSVLLDGCEVEKYSPRRLAQLAAYVPQAPTSAFAFTVEQIVMLGRTPHLGALGFESRLDRSVARATMEMTGVLDFSGRTLDELSGGEAQRVMIARAIAQQPKVLLLDEPTSHLDVKNQLAIYRMMVRLAHDWRMAVVCVSHDVNLAGRFADEMLLMSRGRVIAHGPPSRVISKDVLRRTYDVEVDLIETDGGPPIVVAR